MDLSTFILIVNSLLYISAFVLFQRKRRAIQLGSVVLAFYSLISIGAVLLYNSDFILFDFKEMTVFPFVYLYITLIISFLPILLVTDDKIIGIKMPSPKIMNWLSVAIIIVYLGYFFLNILPNFSISNLFNPDMLSDNYDDKGEGMSGDGSPSILGLLKNVFGELIWVVLMYNWILGNKKLVIGLFFSLAVVVLNGLAYGGRVAMTAIVLQIPFAFIVFRPLMSPEQKKTIKRLILVLVLFVLLAFGTLTFGRFGDKNFTIFDIVLYYFSSDFLMFNNFALDPGACRYGDRVFPLVRSLLGLHTAEDFWDRRDEFPELELDDSQFSFFVGEFCIDFGPVFAFLLILLFSVLFYIKLKRDKYDLGDVLLTSYFFMAC